MLAFLSENYLNILRYCADYLIIATMIYWLLYFLRGTRGVNVLFGLICLLCTAMLLVKHFQLMVLGYLLDRTWTIFGIAIIFIFQPEFRRAFAQAGALFSRNTASRTMIDEIALAAEQMSLSRTGALIIFEQNIGLAGIINNSVILDAQVNALLLETIFFKNSPLHDCAVIIRKNRIVAAHAVLPLTQEDVGNPVRRLGTRHRAAVGITEETDAVALVVSEENGAISLAHKGRILRGLRPDEVAPQLGLLLLDGKQQERKRFFFLRRPHGKVSGTRGAEVKK